MLVTVWAADAVGERRLVIDKMLPGMGERIVTNLAVVHPEGVFWTEPCDRDRKSGRGRETRRHTKTIREPDPDPGTPLAQIIAGALGASLKDDEPNWPTQRNWDVGAGRLIRRHAATIAAAVQSSYDIYTPEGSARFDR